MCTVTYLPKANGDYILTSSRDEKLVRPAALPPMEYNVHSKTITFPKDPSAGGSWIAYSESRTACLLNGGFVKHISLPPYKKSRGLILLDYFQFPGITEFLHEYDFTGIEPFTLIIIESPGLYELRWDGEKIHSISRDLNKPFIWSSATLYTDEVILKRKTWFQSWLAKNNEFLIDNIRQFHHTAGEGDKENDLLMNRSNSLKTVSITTVEKKQSQMTMIYEDLTNRSIPNNSFEIV
jgi:hypothetical protein